MNFAEQRVSRCERNWSRQRIKHHLKDLYGGGTPTTTETSFWTNGTIPWVSSKDMKVTRLTDAADHITPEAVANSAANIVKPGAILMVVRSGILKHSIPVAINQVEVAINQDIKALVLSDTLDAEFFIYWVTGQQSDLLLEWGQLGATVDSLNLEIVRNTVIPLPDWAHQRMIVAYLDRETARIDGLIEKKGRFIELLKEKRAALITHAVTKGIDAEQKATSASEFQLEDTRLDRIFSEVTNLVPLDGIDLLTPSVVHGVVPQSSLGMKPQQALRDGYKVNLAQPDDFVISLSSHAHGIEYCGMEGGISPDYTLLRPNCDKRLIPFLRYALKSKWIIFQMGAFKTGVRMGLRLTWNKVRYCKIGLPSPQLGEKIALYLDKETARVDGLIAKTNRSIELLKEKRSALITAAVTGKIDVRNAA